MENDLDKSNASQSAAEQESEQNHIWDGITQHKTLTEEAGKLRQELADLSKKYSWSKVLHILSKNPELVNVTRPDGRSWFAPLHQAAYGGAPLEVVAALLQQEAFRTLRNSQGERAIDIAKTRSHTHLLEILEPIYQYQIPAAVLVRIQENFHSVMHERAHRLIEEHKLRLPDLEPVLEFCHGRFWVTVPGMYGGFSYWLANDGPNAKLITESWCRIEEGSGQRHEITHHGSALVEEGFV